MYKNVNILHSPNNVEIADTLWDAYASKYNFGHMYLNIKKEETSNFINEISKLYDLKYFKFDFSSTLVQILENDDIFIQIDERKNDSIIYFFTMTREQSKEIFDIYLKYKFIDNNNEIDFEDITLQNEQIVSKIKRINIEKLTYIDKDFYPFLNSDILIEEFLKGKENLLILGGKPGTGKSKFVSLILKWVIEKNFKNNFLAATAKNINLLSMDAFWQKVENTDLLILDDLDFMLSARNENREDIQKNNFLSRLLSFTDGVINNDTKIIITTNQPLNEIDEALLRDGRLFDIINFRPLYIKEGEKILKKHNLSIDDLDVKSIEIYQSQIGSLIENYKSFGKMKKDYLKEDVSLLHKPSTQIGFKF